MLAPGPELQSRLLADNRYLQAGACWGYYQFYRINLLEKEGYLLPDEDTLTLRFYVRSHS